MRKYQKYIDEIEIRKIISVMYTSDHNFIVNYNDYRLSAAKTTSNVSGIPMPAINLGLMTEYLRIGPQGGSGYTTGRREAFPKNLDLRNLYRTHSDSEFSASLESESGVVWSESVVD